MTIVTMDTIIAQYTRPAYFEEPLSQDDLDELSIITPPLSLKFALPPLSTVRRAGTEATRGFANGCSRHHGFAQ